MSEYARRKSDGMEVCIGCCEDMDNIRYEQKGEVEYGHFSDGVDYYRIPTPSEDGIKPGDFGRLVGENGVPTMLWLDTEKEGYEGMWRELSENTGKIIVHDKVSGINVSVPCKHNIALPDATGEVRFDWSWQNHVLHLFALRPMETEMKVAIRCAACDKVWSTTFDKLEPVIYSLWMKLRLLHQCTDFWYERNQTKCEYKVCSTFKDGSPMCISSTGKGEWQVSVDGKELFSGSWNDCRNWFILNLPQWEGQGPIPFDHPFGQLFAESERMLIRYDDESRKRREEEIARYKAGEYDVTIEETLSRTVRVYASDEAAAESAVEKDYKNCGIVLDEGDFVEYKITSKKVQTK